VRKRQRFFRMSPVEVRNARRRNSTPLTPDLDIRAHVSFDRRPGFDEAIAVPD
jgi:hypothetical protein